MTMLEILQALINEATINGKFVEHVVLPGFIFDRLIRECRTLAATTSDPAIKTVLGVNVQRGNSAMLVEFC